MARGTKLVVSARSEPGLDSLVDEIRQIGGEAIAMPADVADFEQVKAIALREILASNHGRITIPPGWKPIPRQSGVRSPLPCSEPSG